MVFALLGVVGSKGNEILEVTRRNIFDRIKDHSPIVILFLDDSEDSSAMRKAFDDSREHMLSLAPPVNIGIFQVTAEHRVPQDFLVYRFPGVLLFTGLEIPKMYVGGANCLEISEWLSLILEGSIEHSRQINSVSEFLQQQKQSEFMLIFLGEIQQNQEFSLYLTVVKKAKAKHSDIAFCHSDDKGLKKYLKAKKEPLIIFFNSKENAKYQFEANLEFFELNKFIDSSKICKFFQFDREELQKQEAAQNNLLILFLDLEEDGSAKLFEAMKATKQYFLESTLNIGVADPYDWNDNSFLQKFNLSNDALPQLLFLNQENLVVNFNPRKYRFDLAYPEKQITKESIIEFYQSAVEGRIPQFYNGEYMDEEERELNEELFADNYKEFSQPGDNYSLILYMRDGCLECGKARKVWLEVIKHFRKATNIKFGIINLSKNDHPEIRVHPPFCLLFHQDQKEQMSLSEMNTPIELKSWLEQNANIIREEEHQYKVKSKQAKLSPENKIEL